MTAIRHQLPSLTFTANLLQQIGDELRLARLRRGRTLENWAASLNCSVSTVQRMENGDPNVGVHLYMSAIVLIDRSLGHKIVAVVKERNTAEASLAETRRFAKKCRGRNRQRMGDLRAAPELESF